VFITECEFDNRDMAVTASTEWRHVSGVRTHRSVKWSLIPQIINSETLFRAALLAFRPLFTVSQS